MEPPRREPLQAPDPVGDEPLDGRPVQRLRFGRRRRRHRSRARSPRRARPGRGRRPPRLGCGRATGSPRGGARAIPPPTARAAGRAPCRPLPGRGRVRRPGILVSVDEQQAGRVSRRGDRREAPHQHRAVPAEHERERAGQPALRDGRTDGRSSRRAHRARSSRTACRAPTSPTPEDVARVDDIESRVAQGLEQPCVTQHARCASHAIDGPRRVEWDADDVDRHGHRMGSRRAICPLGTRVALIGAGSASPAGDHGPESGDCWSAMKSPRTERPTRRTPSGRGRRPRVRARARRSTPAAPPGHRR